MSLNSRIYLRGIDLGKLVEQYVKGEFNELNEILLIENVNISNQSTQQIVTLKETYNTNFIETQLGSRQRFACIGHRASSTDGKYVRLDPNQETYYCMNCLRKFDWEYWGIPIRRREINSEISFFTIDIFCHPRCALRVLDERSSNSIYSHSRTYFSEMYELKTGESFEKLLPASDPRYLKRLNGSLTYEEYHKLSESYTFKASNVLCFPCLEFIEQDS